MKFLVVLCLVVAGVVAEGPFTGYHERIGIPLTARIKEAEMAGTNSGSRIIGGQPAPLGAYPYLVGIVINLGAFTSSCTASMLSNTRVLTAAHCWWDSWNQATLFTLVYGSEYLFVGGVRVATTDVHMHAGWDGSAVEYDIAVVNTNHVSYTNVIQPIALPSGDLENNDFVGFWAHAAGYGRIGDYIGILPNQVQSHVSLQVISNDACRQFFNPLVTERVICTSGVGPVGPVGVCSGDSGGPLAIVHNNQWVQIGVVSFGAFQCEGGLPSGYVRVTAMLPWIKERL